MKKQPKKKTIIQEGEDGKMVGSIVYPMCECCSKTDMDTGHGMCGFPYLCLPCLTIEMTGEDTEEHMQRHGEAYDR